MIKTFKCKNTESLWNDGFSNRIPFDIQTRAIVKLSMLNRAKTLRDLQIPPSNHLKLLQGNRIGQYSIRINDKYRICFVWIEQEVEDVEIVDYH